MGRLDPQDGLLPIGMNRATDLWESDHPGSAADPEQIPAHAADGSIEVGEGTGVVFVLLPGRPDHTVVDRATGHLAEWCGESR